MWSWGRVVQEDAAEGDTVLSDHSTHVSGTLIATGVNPVAKGMSNGAQLLQAYDYNNDAAEMMKAAANGLLISNHSYGTVAGWEPDATTPIAGISGENPATRWTSILVCMTLKPRSGIPSPIMHLIT
jgi:hypothetical protein